VKRIVFRLGFLGSLCLGLVACEQTPKLDPGLTPEQALKTFELEEGFKIELIASEPLVSDPTDMEIDEYGRMYVVEMHGYPTDQSGTGKVKLLTDEDGDGVMDKSVVFADNLNLPNSIMRWKQGLLVADAPYLYYFEDVDGDGVAEKRDTLLMGFALSNPQHNFNNPMYGLDNWIYVGHEGATATRYFQKEFGDLGQDILYPSNPDTVRLPQNANGRSVRFKPDQYALELTASNTQFGHTESAWGQRLLVSNANHIFQEVIASKYLERNPHLAVSNATQSISDHGDACEVFPTTINPLNQLLTDIGVITAASGITAYKGGNFPDAYNQDDIVFVTECVGNLVHVDKIKPKGASFVASRMRERKEFLTSTDAWFRPVNLYVGPDGALYVVDYYRQIIEHPEWMGDDVVKSGMLYNGTDKGRIYRISRKDAGPATWSKNEKLGDATVAELVQKLQDRNYWYRINAQRLLVDRQDRSVVGDLEKLVGDFSNGQGSVHALWTLEGLQSIRYETLLTALQHPEPGVRMNAIRVSENYLNQFSGLPQVLLNMKSETDAQVRFQLLCTLGFLDSPQAATVRNQLLFLDLEDNWAQIAALSANASQAPYLLQEVLQRYDPTVSAYGSLTEKLARMVAVSKNDLVIDQLVNRALQAKSASQTKSASALLRGLSSGLQNLTSVKPGLHPRLVQIIFEHEDGSLRKAATQYLKTIGMPDATLASSSALRAQNMLKDDQASAEKRSEAAAFLGIHNLQQHQSFLQEYIQPQVPAQIQLTIIRTLAALPDTSTSAFLLSKWPELTPSLQDAALQLLTANTERCHLLLDALEKGIVQKSSLGWPRTQLLLGNFDGSIRARAKPILIVENKSALIEDYKKALKLTGDFENGKKIYQQSCALCHQIKGVGGFVYGPDLGTIHSWGVQAIMEQILDPAQSIAPGFDLWSVTLQGGETIQGVLASETPTAITIRLAPGSERTISRNEITELKALNMSAMPPGLEQQITHQEMADLLAFLKKN
jgi:putative membrane-bound dehydrogenase-like protein